MFQKILAFVLCLLFFLSSAFVAAGASEDVFFGPFSAENLNGGGIVTDAYYGNAELTYINFWATWCGPCVGELPALAQLGAETDGKAQVIGILMDAADMNGIRDEQAISAMRKLLDDANVQYPVLYPEGDVIEVTIPYISAIPTTVVVDRHGMMLDMMQGALPLNAWVSHVQQMLP